MKVGKVAAVIVVQFALVVAVLEVVLRLTVPHLPGNYRTGLIYNRHPTRGWYHIPGSRAWLKTPEFTAYSEINSHGLRDVERPYDKRSGVYRVLVLGDSFAEAAQVSLEETFPHLLKQRLASQLRGLRVDVINAGVVAYSTDQQLLYFLEEGVRYRPDLVLLNFLDNDVFSNSRRLSVGGPLPPKPYYDLNGSDELRLVGLAPRPAWVASAETLLRIVLGRSVFASVLKTGVVDHLVERLVPPPTLAPDIHVYARTVAPEWDEAWQITELLIENLRRAAKANGAAFLVIDATLPHQVYPERWERLIATHGLRSSDWDLEAPNRRLREIADRRGWQVFDLLPGFRSAAAAGPPLHFAADGHWTAAGHWLAADLIARYLEERNFLLGVGACGPALGA